MSNTGISGVSSLLKGAQVNTGFMQTKESSESNFGSFLDQISYNQSQSNLQQQNPGVTDNQNNKQIFDRESSGYGDVKITKQDGNNINNKITDKTMQKLDSFEEKLKEVIKEKLSVTDEELQSAMELLGLTLMDLTNPANLANLVAELTGTLDAGGLLLSENFQNLLLDVSKLTKDLLADMDLTPEQLEELLHNLTEEVSMDENFQQMIAKETQTTENTSQLQAGNDDFNEMNTKLGQLVNTEEDSDSVVKHENGTEQEVDITEETASLMEQSNDLTEEGSQSSKNEDDFLKQGHNQPQVTYQTTQSVDNHGVVTQTVTQTYVDVEDIMRQFNQFTSRIQVGQLGSSIEMQLNPANLGKIYLQVAARDGIVTAQLAAENEAVKNVLERQISILKENMNQQGIKVEAVEVTVATQEFARNMEQNLPNQAQQEQQHEAEKKSRRNLNLNELDEFTEELTEEENLTAKMMKDHGNSVDMSA